MVHGVVSINKNKAMFSNFITVHPGWVGAQKSANTNIETGFGIIHN